ncbi:MAG: Crp/Fnr family transcriptional regulator [Terriglobia bacterium]|jgi:CRP-like cAMP-binding protein
MEPGKNRPSIHEDLLPVVGPEGTRVEFKRRSTVFSQGDPAESVFYILKGKIKLTVLSKQGKEAIVGVLNGGSFFGEGCLAGQPRRMAGAKAITDCLLLRIGKNVMIRLLRQRPDFAAFFVKFLLARNIRYEEDLVDQLFNSSEKRLARILLLLSRFGRQGRPEKIIPKISQEDLASMVGTTRSRVNHFMNKFKSLGFIQYNGGLAVHSSLLNVVLHD